MKICYLADANSVHTKKWCEFFNKKGYEIIVISLGDGEIDNTRVYSFGVDGFSTKGHFSKLLTYFSKVKETKRIIRKENPDIIHAHYATSYGMLASLLGVHPYILSVWGSDIYDFPNSGFLQKKLLERNLKKADVILSTSKAMKIETEKYTDKKIEVTPFGVDIDLYKPYETEKLSNFTVGTIKSFYPKYGIEYLIRGFADFLLRTKSDDSLLILGGKGPQEEELKKLVMDLDIEDKVKFLGFLSQEDVIKSFNQMDVAVFPSTLDSESFGVAAVEAGACGVPTV
ncbi:MAG: glycosyltransferase, partial [Tissierellia bacterium]|nr:glycosyltransferase [Tissierellia bacterium]